MNLERWVTIRSSEASNNYREVWALSRGSKKIQWKSLRRDKCNLMKFLNDLFGNSVQDRLERRKKWRHGEQGGGCCSNSGDKWWGHGKITVVDDLARRVGRVKRYLGGSLSKSWWLDLQEQKSEDSSLLQSFQLNWLHGQRSLWLGQEGQEEKWVWGEEEVRCVVSETLFSRWRCPQATRNTEQGFAESHSLQRQTWESLWWPMLVEAKQVEEVLKESKRKYQLLYEFEDLKLIWHTYWLQFCACCCKCPRGLYMTLVALIASGYPPAPTTPPQHAPSQYTPAAGTCDSAPDPQWGRPEGQAVPVSESRLCHEGGTLGDKCSRFLTLPWNDSRHILYPITPLIQQDWPSIFHSGELLDYAWMTLGTCLCSSHYLQVLLGIASQMNYLYSIPCSRICFWENPN